MNTKIIGLILTALFLLMTTSTTTANLNSLDLTDIDPLVDLSVTVEIKQIRSLEKTDLGIFPIDKIDLFSDPDFYVKVTINDEEFTSNVWENMKYIYDPQWSAILNVPDDEEFVNITIQLWDSNPNGDRLCDLSANYQNFDDAYDIDLLYNLKTGHWSGDDWLNSLWDGIDPSGYGRLNGCDDRSIYQNNRDCELWFDIYQNDFDGDGIPYWTEVNVFNTNPEIDNTGEDIDEDGVPIEWEYKWGYFLNIDWENYSWMPDWKYDPFVWEDHKNMDDDEDGLDNVEEYLTSQWGSNPSCKDLFVELDQMRAGPNGEPASLLPEGAKELLKTAYDKHNLVYHLDDGSWEDSGSEMIPFDEETQMSWGHDTNNELNQIYINYFLHNNENNWRRGVFHYGVLLYQCSVANGNAFGSNRYQISSNGLNEKAASLILNRDIVYASAYMHECGHTLNINNPGVDDENSKYPWQLDWWKWRPYKSVMNYGYMFQMVDYSDGSRGLNDFDDWHDMDLTFFDSNPW
ncbi:MAG: hypothetical protein KAW47_06985 [Thermoplasmatales archaeon]|nr:hypothetical protein [Thermoplasmatales archaeon]